MMYLSLWWTKKGATAVKRKWCHCNISVPIAHGDTGAKGKVTGACHARMVGWSRIPGFHGSTTVPSEINN